MKIRMTEHTVPGVTFAADAFTSQIGKTVALKAGEDASECTLVDAEVAPDGMSAELTFDVPDRSLGFRGAAAFPPDKLNSYSFGIRRS